MKIKYTILLLLFASLGLADQPPATGKVAEPAAARPLPPVLAGSVTQAEFNKYSEAKKSLDTDSILVKNQKEQQALLQQLYALQQAYQSREAQLLSTTPEIAAIDAKINAALKPHHK